ncbi:MAG: hypothetical protein ACK5MN_03280 [Lachnospiraceae bacterium]
MIKAYQNISTGEIVYLADIVTYAIEHAQDFLNDSEVVQKEFAEWFFSGNWVELNEDELEAVNDG